MARYPVATGNIALNPITPIVDTKGKVLGVIIQNVSPQDVFVSDDPTALQQTVTGAVPLVGIHLPPDAPGVQPTIIVLPWFRGKWYARAQVQGAIVEAITYEVCPVMPIAPETGDMI